MIKWKRSLCSLFWLITLFSLLSAWPSTTFSSIILAEDTKSSSYDVQASVNYAETWWDGRNPSYHAYHGTDCCPTCPPDYTCDCANFVSQCLITGGLELTIYPSVDGYGCIPSCDNLHDYLANYIDTLYEVKTRDQLEPTWFLPGDVAIFGDSTDPWRHAVFAVTGDATHYATCNAHSQDVQHITIAQFFEANPDFTLCNYYHVSGQINHPPDRPMNIEPTEGSIVLSLTPTLSASAFNDPDPGDYHWKTWWDIRKMDDTLVWDSDWREFDLTNTTVPSGLLEYNTTYKWRVRYMDNHGTWSEPLPVSTTFTTFTEETKLNVPYIHQTYDTPDNFVGSWACAPTCAVMVLTYYDRVSPNPIEVSYPSVHTSDYGTYISQEYTYNAYTFSNISTENTNCGQAIGSGAWGYVWRDSSGAIITNLQQYLRYHELAVEFIEYGQYDENSAQNLIQQEIDNGRPLIGRTYLTEDGHYVVIVGYHLDAQDNFWYLVNDPFGDEPYDDSCWGDYNVQQPVSYSYSQMGLDQPTRGLMIVQPISEKPSPLITSSLNITDNPPYYVGDTINAEFTIANFGTSSISLIILTAGGRDPDNEVADFTFATNITLNPSESYDYQGSLILSKAGSYHFFCAYETLSGWTTNIPTDSGISNTLDIEVENVVYTPPDQPSIIFPPDGAVGISLTPNLGSSPFSDPDIGDTHNASQWQISLVSGDYSTPIFDSGTDASHLTSIIIQSGILNYSTTYYCHVRYQDNHNIWSDYSSEISFTTAEDTIPPDTSIISGPSGDIEYNDVIFEYTGSDDITPASNLTYSYILEGYDNDWSSFVSSTTKNYIDLSNGSYTFKVMAKDEAGNIDPSPDQRSFTVDVSINEIIIEDADEVWISSMVASTGLNQIAQTVVPHITFEYVDSLFLLNLMGSDSLDEVTITVSPRITFEYADSAVILMLTGSTELDQAALSIAPRIIAEYADNIYQSELQSPIDIVPVAALVNPRIIVEYSDTIFSTTMTAPDFDNIWPPYVIAVYPEPNATGVLTDTKLSATFNEPMDSSTINTSSFTVNDGAVIGLVTYDDNIHTAYFTPANNLEYEQEYTANLSESITDIDGNPLTSAYTWTFTTIPEGITLVDISIQPPNPIVAIGSTFNISVTAQAGEQPVSGIAAYINFDPVYLEVQSINPGDSLPLVIEDNFDNMVGTINFSAGKLGEPFPSGTFDVATIEFKALALTSPSTAITFSTTAPRETKVDFGGDDVTGTLTGGTVTVTNALVGISMVLQGGARPDLEGWEIPVTIKFFSPGADVLTDIPLVQFNLMTTKSGGTAICQCSITPGNYDITLVSEHTLTNVKRDVTISLPSTSTNMGILLEGDANDDSIINISDFGILAVSYGKIDGEPDYDSRADFDRNGIVNISDFGLLAVNFMEMSPIEISGP